MATTEGGDGPPRTTASRARAGRRRLHLEGFSTAATPTGTEWLVLGDGGDGSDPVARGDDRRGDWDEDWRHAGGRHANMTLHFQ